MGTNEIKITSYNSPEEAPNYKKIGGFVGLDLEEAVIVRKGTQAGRPTVDIVLVDGQGKKYVAMVSGRIVRMMAQMVDEAEFHKKGF